MDALADGYDNAARGDKNFLRYYHDRLGLTSHPVIYYARKDG